MTLKVQRTVGRVITFITSMPKWRMNIDLYMKYDTEKKTTLQHVTTFINMNMIFMNIIKKSHYLESFKSKREWILNMNAFYLVELALLFFQINTYTFWDTLLVSCGHSGKLHYKWLLSIMRLNSKKLERRRVLRACQWIPV